MNVEKFYNILDIFGSILVIAIAAGPAILLAKSGDALLKSSSFPDSIVLQTFVAGMAGLTLQITIMMFVFKAIPILGCIIILGVSLALIDQASRNPELFKVQEQE